MTNIFPTDFEEKLTMAQDDYILFSDSEDDNKIKKAQYKNLKWEQGDPGTPWADWTSATITVWTTTTWDAWTSASVTNSGTSSAAVLNFTIPKGAKGDPWQDWTDWNDWAAATITVWTTTTLPAWSSATVTNSWTSSAAVLNFGIPKGDSGTWSGDVNWPASSTDWDIVLFDWATGKAIKDSSKKLSDYQTALTTQTAYTSKGTSTKVATITTNTLWQVTGVSETNISFPVTSVNTQTWAVVLDADDISDSATTNKFVTSSDKTTWSGKQDALTLPWTPTSWHLVTWWASNKTFEDWWAIPTWFNPWGTATTWYVVTKTADWYEWAAPSGWDVIVSSDADNVLTTWAGLRAGDEADLPATPDSNTLYFTY